MKEAMHEDFLKQIPSIVVPEMLQQSIALIGVYDPSEVLRYANDAFRSAYFIAPGEEVSWQTLMQRNFTAGRGTVNSTDDIENWISSVRSRRGKSRQRTYESDLHDGRFIWVTETRRDDGWIVYVGTDVTALNASERRLRLANEALFRQSTTDELTGASNRRHILARLEDMLGEGRDAWACLVDIDHFKRINDTFGHHVGDEVLVNVAQTARHVIDLKDSFGRVGGEELLILFGSQPLEDVRSTLRRLQEAISNMEVLGRHPGLSVKISGWLTYVSPKDMQENVFKRADAGLYSAKDDGRDRIYFGNVEIHGKPPQASLPLTASVLNYSI